MIKDSLKQILRDMKSEIKYLKYKHTLPKNPMHDDVYIVEFPKSGITWLQHIIGNIELQLINRNENITYYNVHKYVPDIYQLRGAYINRFLQRTFIKSHSEYNPYYYFVVYLLRNPFDVMVSYYNFMLAHGYKDSFNNFVKNDKYGIKAWKRHVRSWLHGKVDAQRIFLIKYEDLLIKTDEVIFALYKNFGLEIENAIIKEAINRSSLNKMKKYENLFKAHNPNYKKMNFVGKEGKIQKEEIMTEEIIKYIKDVAKEEIREFYEDIL